MICDCSALFWKSLGNSTADFTITWNVAWLNIESNTENRTFISNWNCISIQWFDFDKGAPYWQIEHHKICQKCRSNLKFGSTNNGYLCNNYIICWNKLTHFIKWNIVLIYTAHFKIISTTCHFIGCINFAHNWPAILLNLIKSGFWEGVMDWELLIKIKKLIGVVMAFPAG